jgi:hypothetical protein
VSIYRVESKRARIRRVKCWLTILASLSASLAVADDFKTVDGKEYKDAKVSRVEPDGIVLITKSGISKVYFAELPKEVQERFHYDPQKAAEFTSQTKDKIDALLHQRAEVSQRRAEEMAEEAQIKSQREAEIQRQQRAVEQQRQADMRRMAKSTPSVSKEGMPEHIYELLQDYTISTPGSAWSIRLRRGERYRGRILVDHAEVDINGVSYNVPSGILSAPID